MSVALKYFNKFTSINNNIVIFVSAISQLKSLNLPFSFQKQLNNKEFVSRIENNKFIEINKETDFNDGLIKIKIYLINKNTEYPIEYGSSIYNNFDYKYDTTISFVFSKTLLNNNQSACSDIILGFLIKSYEFKKYINKKIFYLEHILIFSYGKSKLKYLNYNNNLLSAINFCKDLVSEPANILNPTSYAEKCLPLKKIGLKIKILDLIQIKKIGMEALLGVSVGSVNEPRVVILEWNLKKKSKPLILVGKGVTFDTGGISLKPSQGMEEMIFDMAGSAVVVGSMINSALNKSKKSLVGIIGLVENMPDGKSQRPGDIVKSLSGQTIEILNTDAEGRLVLADILTYVQKKYNPKEIIDFATLTGAIMIALGTHRAGLFSNSDKLSNRLEKAGIASGEKLWRLPLGKEYDAEINSQRADIKNIGSSRFGGSIQAAQFLQRFIIKDTPWAHLDIAGVSWSKKANENTFSKLHSPGATAFGVRLIDQFLKNK